MNLYILNMINPTKSDEQGNATALLQVLIGYAWAWFSFVTNGLLIAGLSSPCQSGNSYIGGEARYDNDSMR